MQQTPAQNASKMPANSPHHHHYHHPHRWAALLKEYFLGASYQALWGRLC